MSMPRHALVASVVLAAGASALAAPAPTAALTADGGFPRRAIVARFADAGLRPDELSTDRPDVLGPSAPMLVVEERGDDRVRLRTERDGARLLLWVRTQDLARTPRAPLRVRGDGKVGVWLLPGATLIDKPGPAITTARYERPDLALEAELADALLTRTFPFRRAPRPGRYLAPRIVAAPDGPALLEPTEPIDVERRGRARDGWVMVEHRSDTVRVVGWAKIIDLTRNDVGVLGGLEASTYGITDTARIEVARGTCLFDDVGAVVGLQLRSGQRYAHREGGGRWAVYVDTAWGLRTAYVEEVSPGYAPMRLRRCPPAGVSVR